MNLENQLKSFFGYNEFRQHQKEIIAAILEKQDVVAILPTGAGKSICYQLPAMILPGTAIVVSPLISLMQDQVASLSKNGLSAAFLNSSLPSSEISMLMQQLDHYKLLYVAPERFADKSFIERLQKIPISLIAIDEAHCISQWGHSFRPEYRQLAFLKTAFPKSNLVALTATATHEVQRDIISQLAMKSPFLVRASFDRPNLTLRIYPRKDTIRQLGKFLEKRPKESGIIYAATRKNVDETYKELKDLGMEVGKYHAGMSDEERTEAQHNFIYGKIPLMVATVAFGMGVHKPDIRFVVHIDMPRSIEQYYQEVGRAGRDSLSAECMMLYSAKELKIYELFLEQITDPEVRRQTQRKTSKMFSLCNSTSCRRKELLSYFGEAYTNVPCNGCDNCLDDAEMDDRTLDAQKVISCVYRVQQTFSAKHVVDVLRGAKTKAIYDHSHDKLSTYGLMKESAEVDLFALIHSLIKTGYLQEVKDLLQWTTTTPNLIKGGARVHIRKQVRQKVRKQEALTYDATLFEILSRLRRKIADEKQVPAFVVFGDKTLMEMAAERPTTREAMMQINGVGPIKWEKYGQAFLEILQTEIGAK